MNARGTTTNDRTGWRSLRARGLIGGGTGVAALAAILVLTAPLSSAHGAVTFTAPFTGFTASVSGYGYNSTCAKATTSTPASWNSTTGEFQFAGSARSGACGSSSFADSEGFVQLTSPYFSSPFPGYGYVDLSISTAMTASALLSAPTTNSTGNSSYVGYSAVTIYEFVEVVDATHHNGSLIAYTYAYPVDEYFSGTPGHFSLTQSWTSSFLFASGTFTAGHVYKATVELEAYVFADSYVRGAHAAASIDLGGSNGLKVSSIYID